LFVENSSNHLCGLGLAEAALAQKGLAIFIVTGDGGPVGGRSILGNFAAKCI